MKKDIWIYRLTDAKGNQTSTVVDDPSDKGSIGGRDSENNYQQYDSYELYNAYRWAESFGFKLESCKHTIDIVDSMFNKI